jgi:hypothetical protein
MALPTQAEIIQLNIGDTIPLAQVMSNLIMMGIVTDVNNPNMFASTMQAFQNQAVLTVPVLQGPQGIPGQLTFALRWQNDNLTQPAQLPTNLTDLPADLGKFWVFGVTGPGGTLIATTMYVWWGTAIGFRQLPVGAPGPPGPYPMITPRLVLQVPGSGLGPGGVDSWVDPSGPVSNPVLTFNIAAPAGVQGPSAALGSCPDVDFVSHIPLPGDVVMCSSNVTPGAPSALSIVPHNTGGTLAAGTYFYVVTAYMPNGETARSNEVTTGVITGSTNSVTLSWTVPSGGGAIGYKVYRGTVTGAENVLVAIVPGAATTTFTDIGAPVTPGMPPSVGVVAGLPIWRAVTQTALQPVFYTIPESAFHSQAGLSGSTVTIATFAVPPQPFAWKPLVFGQMQLFGINISLTPLLVGAEVLLGSPNTGVQVAQGFGNAAGYVSIIPQPSDTGHPSAAITPLNAYAKVPANHTGATTGTLYCNLVNQGLAGLYDFNNANSGLVVVVMPVPT